MSNRLYGPAGAPASGSFIALNTPANPAATLPFTQSFSTTAETVLLNLALNSATAALVTAIPPGGPLEQLPWQFVWSGVIQTAQGSTVTMKFYSGTSTTVGSNTLLGNSGATASINGKVPFLARLTGMVYDSISGKLQGQVSFEINNVVVAAVALSNIVTGIGNTNNPVLSICASVTFGTATAPNKLTTTEFAIYET